MKCGEHLLLFDSIGLKRCMWRRTYWVLYIWPSHVHQVKALQKCKTPHLQLQNKCFTSVLPSEKWISSCILVDISPCSPHYLILSGSQGKKKKKQAKQEHCGFSAFCWWASEQLSPEWPTVYMVHCHAHNYGHFLLKGEKPNEASS